MKPENSNTKYFAAVGDTHGHMHAMVKMLTQWESISGKSLAFVIQAGDFEPHRNNEDVRTMAAPAKYKKAGDFPDYHCGRTNFPWPVYFIGGNHEPYGFLDETPSGNIITENCHYLGRVGTVELSNIKIAGISGIFREEQVPAWRPPVSLIHRKSNKEYIYIIKDEVEKILNYNRTDILIMHQWPNQFSRLIIEILEPRVIICAHEHKKHRDEIILESGKHVSLCCLANVEKGTDSFAIFQITPGQEINEIL
ncbi:MAG: hypothetical protein A2Y62_13545 [Candidatus Fischerbacteria bacterium RBG_13_37_8]|uniref:Calcineurin-like phosphoesterase domain-containing protein n=1 Tax=Candidatus Fischerbacteria bacterium RBG_13_37_8 TaxID=1817863 RepID=A0A1F5VXM6_9BACT|nr:MAG: hypothetical protein A2Y62_13545 [Candidatus Fischerbacteria bacterium RBG_13_37_8]